MSNNVKDISKKMTHILLLDDNINTKNFDPNNTEIDEKSYKNIPIYYIRYVTIKDSKYVAINNVNPFLLYFQQSEWIF